MGTSKKVAGLVMTGLLFSAGYAPARAHASDVQATLAPQPSAAVFAGPYSALTPGVATRLPSFLKASDIAGMSPTLEDLQVQSQARGLLIKAAEQVQRQGPFTDSHEAAEYGAGINAYADGRYIETVAHLHAAMATGHLIPVKN